MLVLLFSLFCLGKMLTEKAKPNTKKQNKILREKHRRGKVEVKVILKAAHILGHVLCVF